MTDRRGDEPPRRRGGEPGRNTPPRSGSPRPSSATDRTRATPQRPESTRDRLLRQAREAQEEARRSAAGERRARGADGAAPRKRPAGNGEAGGQRRRPAGADAGAPRKRAAPRAAGAEGRRTGEGAPRKTAAKKAAAKKTAAKKTASGRPVAKKAAVRKAPPRKRPPQRPRAKKPPKTLKLGRSTVRLRVTFGVMAFVLSLFAGRLVLLQGVDPDSYALAASKENNKTYVLHASRGSITDRNGVEFSVTEDTVAITADPSQTKPNAARLAAILAPKLTGTTSAKLIAQMTAKGRFERLVRYVPPQTWNEIQAEIRAANKEIGKQNAGKPKEQKAPLLLGVYTEPDPIRSHPNGSIAATVVGITGEDGRGQSGLEYGLNDKLSGQDGKAIYEVDAKGNKIPNANHTVEEPKPGLGVQLTLDADLQWFAEKRIEEAVKKYGASGGTVIVSEVKSNEILAMANYPTFDPNKKKDIKSGDLMNAALERTFEPGSVQKVVTMAALADAGLIDLNTKLRVPGTIDVQRRTIKDHWAHGEINLTIAGVIAKSSNVGTIMAAQQMRIPQFVKYLHDFGFGEPTGLNFPGESKGLMTGGDEWPEITRSNVAFGQGLSVNAVQESSAVNAVANGGVYVPPKLVRNYVEANGTVIPHETAPPRRVVSEKAAKEVATMMEAVTAEKGTAPQAAIDGYLVAGKTGTAQQVDPKTKKYGKWATSFAGFAPADNPRFVVYVVLHDPTGARGGGFQGGPVFRDVMSYALQKYAVPPTGAKQNNVPITW
ncbi:penicillin-binding protein 2 [Kribbella sandramycini]|uniref:Cell division protein FtsI (Penicillin-binding protein 3) n=1 Tax=Kribbella sandramycini TaxID=60450 RepID=A0A7Y4KUM5_9ACTN|nr:penicillin-binding protein 2 [Kribbella sandramycini]MBB6568568.1 cell division protein FtsI (penicillin-binding protein 3) [Kribbella sandramycini]NOL38845.1 penicillin-binding protein 2 [Kribbella sandramycini]